MDITELLAFSAKNGASDLHLSAGLPPMIRVDGDELDALEAGFDHSVDGIDTSAANPDNLDDGEVVLWCGHWWSLSQFRWYRRISEHNCCALMRRTRPKSLTLDLTVTTGSTVLGGTLAELCPVVTPHRRVGCRVPSICPICPQRADDLTSAHAGTRGLLRVRS